MDWKVFHLVCTHRHLWGELATDEIYEAWVNGFEIRPDLQNTELLMRNSIVNDLIRSDHFRIDKPRNKEVVLAWAERCLTEFSNYKINPSQQLHIAANETRIIFSRVTIQNQSKFLIHNLGKNSKGKNPFFFPLFEELSLILYIKCKSTTKRNSKPEKLRFIYLYTACRESGYGRPNHVAKLE